MQPHWKPQPKQEVALARIEDEILYGGARGGGKTDAGQAWLLYDIDKPRYRALVLRRNADDLKDWIDRARELYLPTRAEFVGNPVEIRFPSGAKIRTGHLKDQNAYTKYQGQEYQKILFEELTHIPSESDYEKVLGSCRSTVPGIKPQVFGTTNPDGPGFRWVKRRFAIPDRPDFTKTYVTTDVQAQRTRVFIPARLEDNDKLRGADPGYERFLESIQDEDLRRAWRDGSWEGFNTKGAYYQKQMQEAHAQGRITNVPYDKAVPVHTWWDIGVGDSTAIGFFQQVGLEWHLIDFYEASGEGLSHYARVLKEKGYVYGTHHFPHDAAAREKSTGRSYEEAAQTIGLRPLKVLPALDIEDGINAVRERFNTLWIDKIKCEAFIERISLYRKEWNDKLGEFKNQPLHDWTSHAADMLRYWATTKTFGFIPTTVQGGVKPYYPQIIAA